MISDKYKFIYIHIPKTGGSSISVSLGYPKNRTPDHRNAEMIKKNFKKDWKSYFKFSFVRNPWDLVVSDFFARKGWHGRSNESFKKYVLSICEWDLQSSFLIDSSGKLLVNYIGRFENIYEDFTEVCKKIGVDATLRHLNSSKHKHYREYYDDESVEKIGKVFKKDIEMFGYNFEGG